ncbi:MAG: tetratricopeptide repeat protein [Pseudomonadota bacterium]
MKGPKVLERRLAAILAADLVGYSRLMGQDEAGTLARMTALRQDLLMPLVAEHRGRIVKLMGDGLLVEFASVVDAAGCAIAWQKGMAKREAGRPDSEALRFRIGLNLGDVILEGDDIYGDGVNVAARLEAKAPAGGICAARSVVDLIKDRLPVTCHDLGELQVKNIARPVHSFLIATGVEAEPEPRSKKPDEEARPPRPQQAQGSIAVFPLKSLSADPDDAYIAEGIGTEIIAMLAQVPGLRVVASAATFGTAGKGDPWGAVRDLNIHYVLSGTVRRAGDRIKVVAELSETSERSQLWSNSYQRQLADIFAVQEEIGGAIVAAVGGEFQREEWRRARRPSTHNLDAWELVQKARSLNLPVNRDSVGEALDLAQRAVVLDPDYAAAHAAVASILMQRVINGTSPEAEKDRARALSAVESATELAPDDPMVLRTLGNVWSNCGKHQKAIRALRRAVEVAPFDFHSWGRLARTLAYGGSEDELREGHEILDRILATAPNHPMVPYWHYFKANALVREGRYEDAVRFARLSLDRQPRYAGAWLTLANALGHLGEIQEARLAMSRAQRHNPAMTPAHLAKQIAILTGGQSAEAERSLSGLRAAGLL